MNNQEKIEAALEKKREGNALLAAGEDARASKKFMKVTEVTLIYFTLIHYNVIGTLEPMVRQALGQICIGPLSGWSA